MECQHAVLAETQGGRRLLAEGGPGWWRLDPYDGCGMGCPHCGAEKRAPPAPGSADATAGGLAEEVAQKVRPGETVVAGAGFDPYQEAERRAGVTRACLGALREVPDVRLSVITRSDLVLRDTDVLASLEASGGAAVTLVVSSLDSWTARRLEPGAPDPRRRLRAVARLRRAGIPAGLRLAPILPGITDRLSALRRAVHAAGRAGALWLEVEGLRLPAAARVAFFRLLAGWRPDLRERYLRRYRLVEGPPRDWEERLQSVVGSLRAEAGLAAGPFSPSAPATGSLQLHLPFRVAEAATGYAIGDAAPGPGGLAVAG